ncbi:hypothetical protein M0811_08510 [Anaeramoeba ignava]|uniref:Kelch repeat-containing protein n=1 Tax=Anaeramoeba ignava TaxID=1746090 RepID=A0A9Q0LLN1_ANAIG|nr:hypothetical protein M0811_08510 [Anaeramoeba ignava]
MQFVGWKKLEQKHKFWPQPVNKTQLAYSFTQNKIYFFGGKQVENDDQFDDLYSFSLTTQEWKKEKTKGKKPFKRSAHTFCGFKDTFWIWGELNQKIESKKPEGRFSHSSVYYKGKIYIFGGINFFNNRLNDLWEFDTNTKKWKEFERKGVFIQPRSSHFMEIYNDKIILFGGRISLRQRENAVYFFDLFSNSWSKLDLSEQNIAPDPLSGSSCFIYEDFFFVFSGFSDKSGYTSDFWVLDIHNKKWKKLTNSNQPSKRFGASCVKISPTKFILFGGQDLNSITNNELWVFITQYEVVRDFQIFQNEKILCDF